MRSRGRDLRRDNVTLAVTLSPVSARQAPDVVRSLNVSESILKSLGR
jgi:hypothetical protein